MTLSRTDDSPIRRRAEAVVAEFLDAGAATLHARLGEVVGVAVTTSDDAGPRTVGASTSTAADVDRIQFEVGTGPCLAALRSGESLYVPDLGADPRWGDYGPRAAARGVASCVSVPVLVRTTTVAVFKVYAAAVDGLSDQQREDARLVALEMSGGFALALHLSRQAADLDDLTALMTHRRAIDLALGVLMERAQVPAAAAFGLLRTQSQQRNVKLHEVARGVVASIPGTSADDLVAPFDTEL